MILQNYRRFPVSIFSVKTVAFESFTRVTGYWKDFQNEEVISKEQAKTLDSNFSSTKKTFFVKTIRACT